MAGSRSLDFPISGVYPHVVSRRGKISLSSSILFSFIFFISLSFYFSFSYSGSGSQLPEDRSLGVTSGNF